MNIVTTILWEEIKFSTPKLHKYIWLYNENADDIEETYKIDFVHNVYDYLNNSIEQDTEKINMGIREHYLKMWTHWALIESPSIDADTVFDIAIDD